MPLWLKTAGIAVLMLLVAGDDWLILIAQCGWVIWWTCLWPLTQAILLGWSAWRVGLLICESTRQLIARRRARPARQRLIRIEPWHTEPAKRRQQPSAITCRELDGHLVEYTWIDRPK